jgi:hypothetical protein
MVVVNRVTDRRALLHHEKPVFPISKRAKVELNSRRDKEVWQYIVGVAAHMEYLAVAILWVAAGRPDRFEDYEDHLTLGNAIKKIEAQGLLAPAAVDTVRAVNRLRNSIAHRGAVSGVTVSGTAQRGIYKGGHVFTDLQALNGLVTNANAAITAMGEWLQCHGAL